jgi:hypothetical protein
MTKTPIKIYEWVEDQPASTETVLTKIGEDEYPVTRRVYATHKKVFACEGFFLGWGQEPIGDAAITRAIIVRSDGMCDMTAVCLIQFDTHLDAQPS